MYNSKIFFKSDFSVDNNNNADRVNVTVGDDKSAMIRTSVSEFWTGLSGGLFMMLLGLFLVDLLNGLSKMWVVLEIGRQLLRDQYFS